MKKYLIKRLSLWIFILWVLSFWLIWNIVYWGCEWTPIATWTRDDNPPGCNSNASHEPSVFNNNINLTTLWSWAATFLKMFNLEWDINCDANKVRAVQTAMQQVWWNCSTCIDGRIWTRTKTALNSKCLDVACPSPLKAPELSGSDLKCSDWYQKTGWHYNCCEPIDLVQPDIFVNWQNCSDWPECKFDTKADDDYEIEIKYGSDYKVSEWNLNWINIVGWTIYSDWVSNWINTSDIGNWNIKFNITPNWNQITINVEEWVVFLSGTNTAIPWNNAGFSISWCTDFPIDGVCNNWYVLYNSCCQKCDHPGTTIEECAIYWSEYVLEENWVCCKRDCSNLACPEWQTGDEAKCDCVCDSAQTCCWVRLNTVVPFIWDCIELWDSTYLDGDTSKSTVTQLTAFPFLMMWLTKIAVTVVLIFSIIVVIASWLLMATWGISASWYNQWKKLLMNVIISLILLWCSWLILKLINPTFFGG